MGVFFDSEQTRQTVVRPKKEGVLGKTRNRPNHERRLRPRNLDKAFKGRKTRPGLGHVFQIALSTGIVDKRKGCDWIMFTFIFSKYLPSRLPTCYGLSNMK